MKTILELVEIRKKYGKKEILKGINLSVQEGEIISVLGPSGCGKSTLLNIIAGILPLDSGVVRIAGEEVSGCRKSVPVEKRNINMVFQDFALWPHMTARDNILYGLKVKRANKEEMEERLNDVARLLHLEELLNHYPSELSGGQQQRVAIARAFITKPAIILLDEPLCNLDVQLRIEMRTEMAQLFRNLKTTVFHVTHDPSEAFAMADRIVVMDGGIIDQVDTPAQCYEAPQTATVAGLLGAGNCLRRAHFVKQEKNEAIVQAAGRLIKCSGFWKKEPQKDDLIELRFRPEECSWTEEEKGNIPAKVVMSSFEGGLYRVKVETRDGEALCLLSNTGLENGQKGFLKIAREKLYGYEQI